VEKVVPLIKFLKTIFYFQFFELQKVVFGSVKILKNLNLFESFESFEWV
jgi:hypothetical protein